MIVRLQMHRRTVTVEYGGQAAEDIRLIWRNVEDRALSLGATAAMQV